MNSFRTFISCFFLLFSSSFYATDLVVNSSGQSGTYTTLSAALTAAASSGDRILIPSTITLIEDITINKSVDIMPLTASNNFFLEGDINITATAGLEIRILGMNFSGDLVCSSGTATETNRCHLYFIDCTSSDPNLNELNADVQGLAFHLLFCTFLESNIKMRFGEIIGSSISTFTVVPGDGVSYNDTIRIIANKIVVDHVNDYTTPSGFSSNRITYYNFFDNQDHYYFISNNFFDNNSHTTLTIFNDLSSGSGSNHISNNTFYLNPYSVFNYAAYGSAISIHTANNYSRANTSIINNIFYSRYSSYYNSTTQAFIGTGTGSNPTGASPLIKYNIFGGLRPACPGSTGNSCFIGNQIFNSPNITVQGYLSDPNNYDYPSQIYTHCTASFDVTNGKALTGFIIDAGKNEINSFDLDMTRNDLGTYGGPYSMENYWDSTATGKARIYNLDMPFEIWSGQTPTIKASAVHTK